MPCARDRKLAFEEQGSVVEHRDDDHRPRMDDVFPDRLRAIGQTYAVAAYFQQAAFEGDFAGKGFFGQMGMVGNHGLLQAKRPGGRGV